MVPLSGVGGRFLSTCGVAHVHACLYKRWLPRPHSGRLSPLLFQKQTSLERPIPAECFDTDSGLLLEFVADCIELMLQLHPPGGDGVPVIGFCFSFGVQQTALDNGALVRWTKVGGVGGGEWGVGVVDFAEVHFAPET